MQIKIFKIRVNTEIITQEQNITLELNVII